MRQASLLLLFSSIFVLRKKGSKMKRTKEEGIEDGPVVYPTNAFDSRSTKS